MAADEQIAQSDDSYDCITFHALGAGSELQRKVAGTVGWREGQENRVVFQVWDGPSFAAVGGDLHEAFRKARVVRCQKESG